MKPSQDRVKQLFSYDPGTGNFIRKVSVGRHGRYRVGEIAGGKCARHGYWHVCVDSVKYSAHRLAWLYMTGRWPADQIDHIDGDRLNNKFNNLREATAAQNSQNEIKPRANNKSGYLGVSPYKNKWRADIKVNGKTKALGYFECPLEAHAAYLRAKSTLHPYGTIS